MDFSDALRAVKDGKRVRRAVWHDNPDRWGCWVELADVPPVGDVLLVGYVDGASRLFAGANWDLLADDWEIVRQVPG